jgi:hypothetical protein
MEKTSHQKKMLSTDRNEVKDVGIAARKEDMFSFPASFRKKKAGVAQDAEKARRASLYGGDPRKESASLRWRGTNESGGKIWKTTSKTGLET